LGKIQDLCLNSKTLSPFFFSNVDDVWAEGNSYAEMSIRSLTLSKSKEQKRSNVGFSTLKKICPSASIMKLIEYSIVTCCAIKSPTD